MITFLKADDLAAYFLDNAATLVTKNTGQRHRKILIAANKISVAYTYANDFNQYLIVFRFSQIQFGYVKGP